MPTSNYSFPYPTLSDAPNVPQHIKALADAVDSELKTVADSVSGTTYTISTEDVASGAKLNLEADGSTTDSVNIIGGTNVTVTQSNSVITISADDPTATTATNLAGTTQYAIPYQSASATTAYVSIGTAGQVLAVNGSANGYTWVDKSNITNLNSLTDVVITSPSAGQVLKYTETSPGVFEWVNGTDSTSSGAGSGDVVGPASSTDNAIARFDLTTGKLLQNSGVTIDDSNNIVTAGDLALNGGDLTTTSATAALFNTNATTVNIGGAATTISIGNASGTTTINNANTVVTGDLAVNGADITTSATGTATVFNTNATTVNAFGAATTISIGASTGTTTLANTTVTLSNATTLNMNGANPILASTSTGTLTLFNTNLTTVNAFGAATTANIATAGTTVTIGATTGTTTVRNLTLGTTSSTTEGRLSWDATYNHANVGDGANTMLVPTFRVQTTAKTGAYSISIASDANTLIQMNGAFAFTVPTDTSAPVGTQIHLVALTTGVTILGATSGVIINGAARNVTGLGLRAAYSSATLIKLADNNWLLVGDLSA